MATYIDPSILGIASDDTITVTSGSYMSTMLSTAVGHHGQTLSVASGGVGGLTWANNGTVGIASHSNPGTLNVQGDAKFEGEITMKGVKLSETLAKIEERLAILHPNPKLEDKWDELKELGKRYKELEAEIIEKEKVWAILKK